MNTQRTAVHPSVWFLGALITLILLLTALGLASRSVAQPPSDMPLQFKIIGKFYDPEKDKNAGGVNSFAVNVFKKKWILDIESSHTLQGSALGSSVLKQIYPPIMSIVGTKEITSQLADPAIEGETFTLTGLLYVGKRMFRVNTLEGPPEEEEGKEEAPGTAADIPAPAGTP